MNRATILARDIDRARRDTAVWGVLLSTGLTYELWQVSRRDQGVPLSRLIRAGFRTDTPAGALVFQLTLEVGATWLARHILNTARRAS